MADSRSSRTLVSQAAMADDANSITASQVNGLVPSITSSAALEMLIKRRKIARQFVTVYSKLLQQLPTFSRDRIALIEDRANRHLRLWPRFEMLDQTEYERTISDEYREGLLRLLDAIVALQIEQEEPEVGPIDRQSEAD